MSNEIAGIIIERRKDLHMTQRDLAEKLNVSDQTVSRWETGASYPDATIIPVLAAALQIDINALFSRSSGEPLSKADAIDHGKITKFEILLIVASILMLLAGGLVIAIHSLQDKNMPEVLIALTIISWIVALSSLTIDICSLIWFRDFYKGKFFTEQYRLANYRFEALWGLSFYFLSLTILFSFYGYGILLSDLCPSFLLGLVLLTTKMTRMKIEWNHGHIALLVVGLFLTLTGGFGWYLFDWSRTKLAMIIAIYVIFEFVGVGLFAWVTMSAKPKPDHK